MAGTWSCAQFTATALPLMSTRTVGLSRRVERLGFESGVGRGPYELQVGEAVGLLRLDANPVGPSRLQRERRALRQSRIGKLAVVRRIHRTRDQAVVEVELELHRTDEPEPIAAGRS